MSVRDFFRLLRRYLALVVVLPLAAAAGVYCFLHFNEQPVSYTAKAYVVVAANNQLAPVNGAASSAARDFVATNSGFKASANSDSSSLTVVIIIEGPDEKEVVNAANNVASSAVSSARAALGKDKEGNDVLSASIQKAASALRSEGSNSLVFVVVGFLAGLFAAIVIVMAINAIRRPVKGPADLASASRLPVIGEIPGDSADRLLANVRFVSGDANDVLVVPVQNDGSAALVRALIDRAVIAESAGESEVFGESVHVSACDSVLHDIAAAYQAREARATLIACTQWKNKCSDVESAAAELQLAGANVVGCVLVGATAIQKAEQNAQ